MKKGYVAPTMVCEEFAANEYVAACGDSGTTYLFSCDAGDGNSGYVESDNGSVSGHYHACGAKHKAESDEVFLAGTYSECIENWYPLVGYVCSGEHKEPVDVIIWTGEKNDNIHCTTQLDMSSWETAKS